MEHRRQASATGAGRTALRPPPRRPRGAGPARCTALLAVLLLFAGSLAAAPPKPGDSVETRNARTYAVCMDLARNEPAKAQALASTWEKEGGGEGARHCAAVALLSGGQYDRAAAELESLAATTARPGADIKGELFAQAAQAWLIAGDSGKALAAQGRAIDAAGPKTEFLVDRSIILASLGRYWEAIDDLGVVLDRDAGRVDALVYRATAWRHIGNLDLALDDARRALKIAPGHLDALLESGIVRRLQGDAAGAAADWRRLIDIDPRATAAAAARENLGRLPK